MSPSRRLFLISSVASRLGTAQPAPDQLWPGSKYTGSQKSKAIQRGLVYINSIARKKKNFKDYGSDYIWCFYTISSSSLDPQIKEMAWRMGQALALHWRTMHATLPENASTTMIIDRCFGSYCADSFGVRDEQIKKALAAAASKHSVIDFLDFDPAQPIPSDVPQGCPVCHRRSPRGSTSCVKCHHALKLQNPYDLLCDALLTTYSGDRYGVKLGASFPEIVKLIPSLRPYKGPNGNDDNAFYKTFYTITHIVYTLNDYGMYRLNPAWLPQEFEFLKTNFKQCLLDNDPESMGEFLDTLKAFGLTEQDPLIQQGEEFLLDRQNADGSWGNPKDKDSYNSYHSTWTAVGGLLDFDWRGERASFPEALTSLGVRI